MADYIYSMETRLTPDQQRGVNLVQEIARHAGLNLYLTGGAIRDLITGFPIRDIDLSIQGNPLKLQKELEKAGISVQGVDEDLRTLHLLMPGNVRAELNLTRLETYDKPGKPPVVYPGDHQRGPSATRLHGQRHGFVVESRLARAAARSLQWRGRYRSQGTAGPTQLCFSGRSNSADTSHPAQRPVSLAAGRANPGPLRLGEGKQLYRVCDQALGWHRTRAV